MNNVNIHTTGPERSFHDQIEDVRKIMEENLRYTKVIHELTPKGAVQEQNEMQKLIKDNFEYTKACYALLEKLNRWLFWHHIYTAIKIIVIGVPLILGIIYLPPFFVKYLKPFFDAVEKLKTFGEFVPK